MFKVVMVGGIIVEVLAVVVLAVLVQKSLVSNVIREMQGVIGNIVGRVRLIEEKLNKGGK